MKALFALLLLLLPAAALAQVDLHTSLTQEAYLPGEAMEVSVRISNFSGRRVTFGADPQWIRFNLEASEGHIVNQTAEIPDSGEFSLESSTRGTIRFDLQPLFDLTQPGRYRLTTTVVTPSRESVVSTPVKFEVIRGSRIWEREFGLPGEGNPERRKYLIQQANHLKDVRMYVRITDASEAITYKVVPVGRLISFARPDPLVDRLGRLHLLNQSGADEHVYLLITPDGEVLQRESYRAVERRPKLRMNDAGEVTVFGGERRRSRPAAVPETAPAPVPSVPASAEPGIAKPDELPRKPAKQP